MTLDELDSSLPNGFHDMYIGSLELDYSTGTIKLNVDLLVGWPEDSESERNQYQKAIVTITGLCFCSIDPPYPGYPLSPSGRAICVGGDPAKADHLPSLPDLLPNFPEGVWCYRFFVHDWNAFIHIAARDAEVAWIGPKPKHAK
jgi:hypothetical protein